MLKLTNSFYRCLWFTCEKVDRAHVRSFPYSNCKSKQCGAACNQTILASQLHTGAQSFKQHGGGKKRPGTKTPVNIKSIWTRKPMSNPWQPTSNHVSIGGQFQVNDNNFFDWWRESGEGMSSGGNAGTTGRLIIPPDFRMWETVSMSCTREAPSFQFKVVSYNVLAQYLLECHPYLYTGCEPLDLKWDVRASRLFDEITAHSPDILCLQEVQASHMESFYKKFEEIGYAGIFKQKTGHRQDGCAIYYKKSVFDLKDHITVEFHQPDMAILNRDNIGMIVKLTPRGLPESTLVVATTHLLFNPKRNDVRLAQMQVFLAEIDRFAYYSHGWESGHLPIIMTGDFNSTPDSVVIKLLDRGHVSASSFRDSSDWKRIGVTDNCQHLSVYQKRMEGRPTTFTDVKIFHSELSAPSAAATLVQKRGPEAPSSDKYKEMFNGDVVGHALGLRSVYDKVRPEGNEATTYQDYWVTVDYIYFSSLKLLERLRLPLSGECEALGRLPNEVYASDHLALAALFELRPCKSTL